MSKDQPVLLPGTKRSIGERFEKSDDHLSSVDSGDDEVAGSSPRLTFSDRPSVLSAEAPEFVPSNGIDNGDPFAYQLAHPSPQRNRFIARGTHSLYLNEKDNVSTTASGSHDTTPHASPLLGFLPSSSSTGYTLSGLPVVTLAEKILHAPSFSIKSSVPTNIASSDIANAGSCLMLVPKVAYYIPYLQLGYLELTDELISCICPHDLAGISCPHDEVYEWNWIESRWETGGGGCGMLRLCEALHSNPPPPQPDFVFPVLVTHPDLTYRTTGYHGRSQVTSHASGMTASSEDDPSYRLYTGRPMTSTLRAPTPRERLLPPSLLPMDHPDHALHCPHLHAITRSCSSVTRRHPCVAVSQGRLCEHGHDLASTRAYSEKVLLPQLRQEYLKKRVRPGTVFLDQKGRWCWQRKEVIWRVGEMIDVGADEQSSWTGDEDWY